MLNVLRDHPDAWTKVDRILEFSKCQETKYYALQILEKAIKTRWKVLPSEQCEGAKQFIVVNRRLIFLFKQSSNTLLV